MSDDFYVAENPSYTILHSARDSVRFVLERCLTQHQGRWCAKGSFVDADGEVMGWHDFGHLEGPGWAANAVGGAVELYRWGRIANDPRAQEVALSLCDHVQEAGFVDRDTGFIRPYRHTVEDRFCLNFRHNDAWVCPGSLAKVALQCWELADAVEGDRARGLRETAWGFASWLTRRLRLCDNGWVPRRCTARGEPYPQRAEGGPDPIFHSSADGLYVVQLLAELGAETQEYHPWVDSLARAFVDAGGFFGSINHDTYDPEENVSYAVAFRVLRRLAELWQDASLRDFAYERCLEPMDRFKMTQDRNGVATKGLLWMERSWDTAYLWENAEASLAYMEAYGETEDARYLRDGLTILRAIARHHHGEWGFLTEGVDWNNHVGRQHHFDEAEFGDIRYTEPLLNNLHHVAPVCEYVEKYASPRYFDFEGNLLLEVVEP
jgi:hypothetical protein